MRLKAEDNTSWTRELIDTISQEYTMTYLQAKELMECLDDDYKIYACSVLYNRIINRHFKQDIFQWLPNIDTKTSVMTHLGQAFNFRYYNPTGHYKLKLSNKGEREVAMTLLMLNNKYSQLVNQGIISDRSKMGNISWFRNEKLIYNNSAGYGAILGTGDGDSSSGDSSKKGIPFIYSEDFVLPKYGTLECDFIYLVNPPLREEETSEEKQDLIKNLLLGIEGQTEKQIAAFVAFSEYLVLSSEQLCSFIDLIDDPKWKADCYIAGVGRIYDTREYDFIK